MGQKIYAPIWISSVDHLEQFSAITSPIWRKLLGIYKFPPSFPRVIMNGRKLPFVYFAKGELSVFERQMNFRSYDPSFSAQIRYEHVSTTVHFDLEYASLRTVERYSSAKSFIKFINLNWIRIQTEQAILEGDFLLCVGGQSLQIQEMKQKTDELYERLLAKVVEFRK